MEWGQFRCLCVSVKTFLRRRVDDSGNSVAAVSGPVLGSGCCAPPHQKEPSCLLLKKLSLEHAVLFWVVMCNIAVKLQSVGGELRLT